MPLYPAIKLMDTVMGVDTGGGDTFDFKPELTTEPTAPAPSNGGGDPIRYEFDGDETLILNLYKQDDGQTFDNLAVDPTNPNTGHTPEWSNLRSGDPGLPAVQKDDTFDFTTEPTVTATAHETQRLIVVNTGNGGLARSNAGDGGIIIDFTPGPDANTGLPAVQTDDGDSAAAVHTPGALLFSFDREPTAQEVVSGEVFYKPPAQTDDGLLLPAVQTGDTDALGDPVTFTYTIRNTSSAYEGTHALYQDVVIPSFDTGPALAIEEITIAHEGIWL